MGDQPEIEASQRVYLFGRARIEIDGRTHDPPELRRRAVRGLLCLVAAGPTGGRHRDVIIDALWPELSAESGASQLYKTIHFLRRALGSEHGRRDGVLVERERIRLGPTIWVDLAAFLARAGEATISGDAETLEEALAIAAAGPLLGDDPYEAWAGAAREQVERARLELLRRLASVRLDATELEAAETSLTAILSIDRTDEAAHRGLMAVARRRNDWRAAIRQYQLCRECLWEDLGVEPSPETEAARQDVLASMLAAAPEGGPGERAALLEELGDALRQTGQTRRAMELYASAIRLYEPIDDPAARRVRGKLALIQIVSGDLAAAEEQIGPIRDSLEREWPAYLSARTLYLLAQLRWHSGRHREALEAAEQAVAAARASADVEQQARAQEVFALACHALGDWRRGFVAELERERIAADTGFGYDEVLEAHLCLWEYSLYGDRSFAEVEGSIRSALDRAEESGNVAAMAVAEHAMGSILMVEGRWAEAHQALSRSIRLAKSVGAPQGTVLGLQRLALLETVAGDIEGGHRRVLEAFAVGRASSSAQVQLHSFSRMNATLALNRFLAGEVGAASDAVTAAGRVQREAGECITCDSLIHPVAVPIHLAAGNLAAAESESQKTEESAASFRGRSRAAVAHHTAGLVLAGQGRWIDAERRLARAVAIFEGAGQPFELGRSLVAIAAVRRAAGTDAGQIGLRGEEILRGLGADVDPDRTGSWLA
jgi:DNA-binding SARP family transcriptional activator